MVERVVTQAVAVEPQVRSAVGGTVSLLTSTCGLLRLVLRILPGRRAGPARPWTRSDRTTVIQAGGDLVPGRVDVEHGHAQLEVVGLLGLSPPLPAPRSGAGSLSRSRYITPARTTTPRQGRRHSAPQLLIDGPARRGFRRVRRPSTPCLKTAASPTAPGHHRRPGPVCRAVCGARGHQCPVAGGLPGCGTVAPWAGTGRHTAPEPVRPAPRGRHAADHDRRLQLRLHLRLSGPFYLQLGLYPSAAGLSQSEILSRATWPLVWLSIFLLLLVAILVAAAAGLRWLGRRLNRKVAGTWVERPVAWVRRLESPFGAALLAALVLTVFDDDQGQQRLRVRRCSRCCYGRWPSSSTSADYPE